MPPDDSSHEQDKRKRRENPWSKPQNPGSTPSPWSSGPANNQGRGPARPGNTGRGPGEPPGIDEILAQFQKNLNGSLPPSMQGLPVIAIAASAILLLWLASGLFIVNPGEHAVIQRFGAWHTTKTEPGLGYHLPAPFEKANILNVQQIRRLSIGTSAPSQIQGVRDMPRPAADENLMLTEDRNIVDLTLEVQWNIKNSEDFLFNIEDQEGTIKKVAESAIREIVGQTPMFQIITSQRQQVADRTKKIIQSNLDEYKSGVNITQILIQKAEVHPDVQDAFQDVQSAKQDAEDVQNRAQAYREDIIPKARGQAIQLTQQAEAYKQSTVAKAKGDAERFNAIYTAYLGGKDVTRERIYLETMEEVLKNAKKTVLDSKSSQGVLPYLPLGEAARPAAPKQAAQTPAAPEPGSLQ